MKSFILAFVALAPIAAQAQSRYAVIADTPIAFQQPDGSVATAPIGAALNVVLWNGVAAFAPPAGTHLTLFSGQTIWAPPATVPQSAEMWKAKAVMAGRPSKSNVGKTLLDDANGVIAAASQSVQIAWANAADLSRSSQTVGLLATSIGLSSADLDALFIAAAAFTLP